MNAATFTPETTIMHATTRPNEATAPSDTADREIVTERLIDAPIALVFEAWTDPRHVGAWFGPDGFTTTTQHMDVRPGGVWRFTMLGPDGTVYPNLVSFQEVTPPSRLVYLHGDDTKPDQFHVTMTLEERDGGTLLRLRSLFETAAAREFVVRERGAIEGATQTIARLAEYARTMR